MQQLLILLVSHLIPSITASSYPSLSSWPTTWQTIQMCSTTTPTNIKCPGSNKLTTSETCNHLRCCWYDNKCIQTNPSFPINNPTREEINTVTFYAGDQSATSLSNLRGGLVPTRNALGFTHLAFAPFFQGGGDGTSFSSFPSNLTINEQIPIISHQRWRPYEMLRNATTPSTRVFSSIRLSFDQNIVLMRLQFENIPNKISMRLPAQIKWYEPTGWEWGHPGPSASETSNVFRATISSSASSSASSSTSSIRSCDITNLQPSVVLDDCNSTDTRQQWQGDLFHSSSHVSSLLYNLGTDHQCLSNQTKGPMSMSKCSTTTTATFTYTNGSIIMNQNSNNLTNDLCLDAIHGFPFTDIGTYKCHLPTNPDYSHQQFYYDNVTKQIKSIGVQGQCVRPMSVPPKRACVGISMKSMSEETTALHCELSVDEDHVGRLDCTTPPAAVSSSSSSSSTTTSSSSSSSSSSSFTLGLVLVVGEDNDIHPVEEVARSVAMSFNQSFENAHSDMENWWSSTFTPPSTATLTIPTNKTSTSKSFFSGNFPTLVTNDMKLSTAYYGSLLSFLAVGQKTPSTKLHPLPKDTFTAFKSVGPDAGVTALYFWDTGYTSDLWALLEPKGLSLVNELFLQTNLSDNNVLDVLTERGAGKYYAFSRLSTFLCLYHLAQQKGMQYVLSNVSTSTSVSTSNKTILQAMDELATFWKDSLPTIGGQFGLSDYGPSPNNFLECVPSYIHAVAALQAGNTWMMREVAKLHQKNNNHSRSQELLHLSNITKKATQHLYQTGKGYYGAAYPNGTIQEVRTCVDFLSVGTMVPQDITELQKQEMVTFVNQELLTPNWMRALSLADPAAGESDRADHGPRGSWDGWLGLTATAFGNFGRYEKALSLIRATGGVLSEGPFGQAHRVYGNNNHQMVQPPRKGGDQAYHAVCGGTIASAVINTLFGFRPSPTDTFPILKDSTVPRGFDGVLKNVRHGKSLYTIISSSKGLTIEKQ